MRELTDKQKRFVAEYLVDLNATQAAIRTGYSRKTARQQGQRLLTNADILAAVREAQDERAERTRVDADKVVKELAKLGFSDMREVASWDENGVRWRHSGELTNEAAASIKDVTVHREVRRDKNGDEIITLNTKLVLHDKKGALELLGRHLGMFKDNLNLNTDRPFVVRVKGLSKEE